MKYGGEGLYAEFPFEGEHGTVLPKWFCNDMKLCFLKQFGRKRFFHKKIKKLRLYCF